MKIPTIFIPRKDLSEKVNELLRKSVSTDKSQMDFRSRWSSSNLEFLVNDQTRYFLRDWINLLRPPLTKNEGVTS